MKNTDKLINEISSEIDVKVNILTVALIKELQSFEFQNEYTHQLRVKTLRVFADVIEKATINEKR